MPGTKNGERTKMTWLTFSEEMKGVERRYIPRHGVQFPRASFPTLWTRSHAVGLSALQNLKRAATSVVSVDMRKPGEPEVEYVAGKRGLEWKQGTGYLTMSYRIPLVV